MLSSAIDERSDGEASSGDGDDEEASSASCTVDDEDPTEWRRGDADDRSESLEDADKVAAAFESLNQAIERNNQIEAAHSAQLRQVQARLESSKEKLAPLSKAHAKQIRKLELFRQEQAGAQEASERLRRLSLELSTAKEVLQCASEALALQRAMREEREAAAIADTAKAVDGCTWREWQIESTTFREAEAELERRRAAAACEVRTLASRQQRCAREAERRTKRVLGKSAALGEIAAGALPYLARQASMEEHERQALAVEREAGAAAGEAKAAVKQAMTHLEQLSLHIQAAQSGEHHHEQEPGEQQREQDEDGVKARVKEQQQQQQQQAVFSNTRQLSAAPVNSVVGEAASSPHVEDVSDTCAVQPTAVL